MLTEQLARFARLVQVARSRSVPSPGQERDRAAYLALQAIGRLAPVRQRSLADALPSEASSLSRHVTFLTEKGLVRRLPDDRDARAYLLELTESGAALTEQLHHRRESHVADLLSDWSRRTATASAGCWAASSKDSASSSGRRDRWCLPTTGVEHENPDVQRG